MGGKSVSNWAAAVAIILLLTLAPGIVSADSGNTVAGNTVKWSSAQGDLVVWPHTSNDLGTQTQYANVTWKLPSTNLDVAFKFSIPITGRIYLWQNISHSVTVSDYGSQTVCSTVQDNATLQNITTCWNQTGVTGSHTEQRYYYDWDDISGALTHTVVDGSHYYWINNVAFAQGETKQVKWQYAVPINSAGKWSLFVKRSYASLESALANDLFVELDPWWNASWAYKEIITVVNNNNLATLPANYTINVTFDHGSLVSAGKSLASGDDVRVVYNDATELDRINVTAFSTGTTTIVFRTQADIPAGGNASNYELYYGNPNAGAPPADPNNVYLIWDDFTGTNGANLSSTRWGVLQEGNAIVDIQSNQARFYSPGQRFHDAEAWTVKNFTNTTGLDISFDWISVSCGNNARWRVGLFNSSFIPPDAYPPGQNLHVSDGCNPGAAGYIVYRNSTSVFSEGTQTPPKAIRFLLDTDNWMKVYKNGTLSWEGTWNRTDGDFRFLFYVGGGGTYGEAVTMYFDNVKMRKYLSPEPNATIVTTPPTTTNAPEGWQNAPFNVTLTCHNGSSGCSFTTYRVDGGSWTNGTTIPITTDGNHILEYYSVDVAGNTEATNTDYAALDTTPSATNNNAPEVWRNTAFNVTLTCNDALSGCSFTTYRVDGGSWTNGTTISITTDGNHTLEYYSVDVAGNAEATNTDYAALDKTPPTLTVTSPINTTYQATYFDLNFTAVDALHGVAWTGYSLDGGPNVTSGNTTLFGNANGSHHITVYANDSLGNMNSGTVYFTLKPLAVFIDLKTDNPSYARGDKVTITANVSNHDNVSHNDFKVNFLVRDPNSVLVHNDTVQVPNINPGTAKDVFTRYTIASNATLGTYTVEGRLFDATNTYDIKGITFQVA